MTERYMAFTLDRQQRRVCNAVEDTDNASGIVLNGVHIRKGIAEAADGFSLVQVPIAYDGDETVVIPVIPKSLHGTVTVVVKGDEVTFSDGEMAAETTVIPGKFPDCDKACRHARRRKPSARVALSPSVLRKLLASLPSDTVAIRLYVYGQGDGVNFVATRPDDAEVRGAIMPMLVKWEDTFVPGQRPVAAEGRERA
jgi:hypothetical protein